MASATPSGSEQSQPGHHRFLFQWAGVEPDSVPQPVASRLSPPAAGTINTVNVPFASTPIVQGTSTLANGLSPNGIPFAWANNSASTPLYSFTAVCGDGVTKIPSGSLAGFTPQPCNVLEVDHNLRTPYVAEYSFDVQRSFTSNLSLTIGYVGNHGTKMLSALEINQPAAVPVVVPGLGTVVTGSGWAGVPTRKGATAANILAALLRKPDSFWGMHSQLCGRASR